MRYLIAVTTAAALFALALGGTAYAADTAPPLAGETLQYMPFEPTGNSVDVSTECNPNGTSTLRYDVTGVATGPYPGTFTAHVVATVGPHTPSFVGFASAGALLSFHETFHIDSVVGTVDGTKTMDASPPNRAQLTNIGECFSATGLDEPPFFNETGHQNLAYASATYDAEIHTAVGTSHDTGATQSRASDLFVCQSYGDPTAPPGCSFGRFFQEQFLVSVPAVDNTPAAVTLSPATAVNNIGTSHTVTATVTNAAGGALQGVPVLFTTAGATSTSGSCTTNASGQCSYTYPGPFLPGADVITACADSNGNGTVDAGEPCGTATKSWVGPASKDACKNDLWKTFGVVFKNQGDCVSFVATAGKNLPAIVG